MLLQPIVENAIEHGLETTPNPKVTIEVSLENNTLLCKITDNGIGYSNTINKQKSTKKSFATAIIKERLKYLSKKHKQKLQYRIKDAIINKQIAGTKVLLHLPIIN
jgi:Predicted signal transduction protein with a C-terminal ATPase domain